MWCFQPIDASESGGEQKKFRYISTLGDSKASTLLLQPIRGWELLLAVLVLAVMALLFLSFASHNSLASAVGGVMHAMR